MSKLKTMNSMDGLSSSAASEMSLTGLRFVDSVFKTARESKAQQGASGGEEVEDSFQESLIINQESQDDSEGHEIINFSSNQQRQEKKPKNRSQDLQYCSQSGQPQQKQSEQCYEGQMKIKFSGVLNNQKQQIRQKQILKASNKSIKKNSLQTNKKFMEVVSLIQQQPYETSQVQDDKTLEAPSIETKYIELQREFKKIKKSFKRQERVLNAFLDYQLQSTMSNFISQGFNRADQKQQKSTPNILLAQKIRKCSVQQSERSIVESQIQDYQENVTNKQAAPAVESDLSLHSKKTLDKNQQKDQDESVKTKRQISQSSQFQAYKISMFKSSKKERILLNSKKQVSFQIPEAQIQQFPKNILPHDKLLETAKSLFLKFEEIHVNKFDERITIVKNQLNQIIIQMVSTRTKKESFLIIWKKGGYFYIGEEKDKRENGRGFICYQNLYKYKGQFKNGNREGKGRIRDINGREYIGQWKNNKQNGYGEEIDNNGNNYIGQWKDGFREGKGVLKTNKGDEYEGSFAFGLKNGYGIWKGKTGDVFKGNFQNDKKQGYGEYYSNGELVFQGQFKNGFKIKEEKSEQNDKNIPPRLKRVNRAFSTISHNSGGGNKNIIRSQVSKNSVSLGKKTIPHSNFQARRNSINNNKPAEEVKLPELDINVSGTSNCKIYSSKNYQNPKISNRITLLRKK